MDAGESLIVIGTLAAIGAALARTLAMGRKDRLLTEASVVLSVLTFVSISAVLLLLTDYFLSSNMDYLYVWSNSSTDLSAVYKLSGVWAGAEGSFLLWIWFMALVLVVEVLLEPKRKYLGSKFHGAFQATVAAIISLFMILLWQMDLFARTGSFNQAWLPNGYGMNLLLQTPEMVLHPPVVFAGYAFCVAAFAAALAYLVSDDPNWVKISLPWSRLGWIFLTLGIGVGAIWAYYVLGWGGYWAWDPVETASLLPWLITSAFLHTVVRHSRKGEYKLWSPVLGMLSFVAVIFATFATRAGSVWAQSVHNFGSSEGTTGIARLTYLLQNDGTILGIFSLMLTLLALTVFLAYSRYRSMERPEEQPEPEKLSEYISDKNNTMLTVLLLVITSAVMVLLMFKNLNTSQGANYVEFNQKLSIFFVGLMTTMSVCLVWKFTGKEIAFYLGSGLIVASIAAGVVGAVTGWIDALVAFSLPAYAVALGVSIVKLARSRVVGSARKTLQKASPHLIHLGVAMVLASFIISTNMQSFPSNLVSGTTSIEMSLGQEAKVGDYTVRLVALTASDVSSGSGATSVNAVREGTMDIMKSGHALRSGLVLTDLYLIKGVDTHVVDAEVYVYKSLANDLYLDFQWMSNTTALVQMKVVPMMNALWGGFGLLVIGLAIRTAVWQQGPKEIDARTGKPDRKKEVAPSPPKTQDCEAPVEEELKKFKESRGR
jgi:cytochrome c-type biogenesis protein CcmF